MKRRLPRRFLDISLHEQDLLRLLLEHCRIWAGEGDGLAQTPDGSIDPAALPADLRVHFVMASSESGLVRVSLESDGLPDPFLWKGGRHYHGVEVKDA